MDTHVLSHKYAVPKPIDESLITRMRAELTLQPRVPQAFASSAADLQLFEEDDEYVYVPRYYGLNTFQPADLLDRLVYSADMPWPQTSFEIALRGELHQPQALDAVMTSFERKK